MSSRPGLWAHLDDARNAHHEEQLGLRRHDSSARVDGLPKARHTNKL